MNGQGDVARNGGWSVRALLTLLVGFPVAAVANHAGALGALSAETAKGAAGGAFVGIVLVLARRFMA